MFNLCPKGFLWKLINIRRDIHIIHYLSNFIYTKTLHVNIFKSFKNPLCRSIKKYLHKVVTEWREDTAFSGK